MHLDPTMPVLVASTFVILVLAMVFHKLKQPPILAYILAGIAFGPSGFDLIKDHSTIEKLGDVGVLLLLFFLGMEISLPNLLKNWKVAIGGTAIQILVSLGLVIGLGSYFNWPITLSIIIGMAVSLSSTAVIIPLLNDRGATHSKVGQDVIGILLVQDFALVPMIIVIGLLKNEPVSVLQMTMQLLGGLLIFGLIVSLLKGIKPKIPFSKMIKKDHQLQVFAAFGLCFGMALLSYLFGLSTVIGAFLAGLIISHAKETNWVKASLEPYNVLLVAMFFISIGMLIDISFISKNIRLLLIVVTLVFTVKGIINTGIFRALGRTWKNSIMGGAFLGQIGEFSFILAAIGWKANLINEFGYQMIITIIALTLLISPLIIFFTGKIAD